MFLLKKKAVILCFLSSVLLLNSCSAPVAYALEDNKFYITNEGYEGLFEGSFDNDYIILEEDDITPYIATEGVVLYGGALIVASILASSYNGLEVGSFKSLSVNLWCDVLSSSVKDYFNELYSTYEEGKALEIRKDMVREILDSFNDYTSKESGNIIYDSVVNGNPLKIFNNGLDMFTKYDSSLIFYALGSSITINGEYNLSAVVSEDGKLKMLVNGAEPYMYDEFLIDKEKNITLSITDNRMNSIRPLVGSEVFYIQFMNKTNNKEGFALCYTHEGGVYIYGLGTLNISPNSSVVTTPDSSIKNEELLAGSGSISMSIPSTFDDLISNNKVNSSTMTDTITNTVINENTSSGGVVGGSGAINFSPLMNLGSGLKNVFPFCLPFDLYDILSVFEGEPLTPVFDIDFSFIPIFKPGEVVLNIDFTPFNGIMKLVRVVEYVSFCIALILLTRGLL